MFKNFSRCNAAVSDLYDGKSKNKIAVVFFPNSCGWVAFMDVFTTQSKKKKKKKKRKGRKKEASQISKIKLCKKFHL